MAYFHVQSSVDGSMSYGAMVFVSHWATCAYVKYCSMLPKQNEFSIVPHCYA